MRGIGLSLLSLLMLVPSLAAAGDLSVGLDVNMSSANDSFDADGEKTGAVNGIDGGEASGMVVNVGVDYGVMDNLSVHLNLPYVSNSFSADVGGTTVESDGAGLGDVSMGATYTHGMWNGGLDVKLGTGTDFAAAAADGDLGTGSGSMDIGVGGGLSTEVAGCAVDVSLGYWITGAVTVDVGGTDVETNSGDAITFSVGGTYAIGDNLSVGLAVDGYSAGDSAVDGTTTDDTGSMIVALTPSVNYSVNESINVSLALSANRVSTGLPISHGIPLMGVNDLYGSVPPINLGLDWAF